MTEYNAAAIVAAIENRQSLRIDYDPGGRIIEPHAIGYSLDRHMLLRAYQASGASSSGEHEHWKLFRVDRIRSLEAAAPAPEMPRDGDKRGDRAMKGGIISEV